MMKLTKGKNCLLLLAINIFVGIPIFLTTYLSTPYYVVTTFVTNKEGIDNLVKVEKEGYDQIEVINRTFKQGNKALDSHTYSYLSRFKRISDNKLATGDELTDIFEIKKTKSGLPVVISTSSRPMIADIFNSKILYSLTATSEVETESHYKPQLCLASIMLKVFSGYVWIVAIPTLGYWLYVALWPSKDKTPCNYDA